MRRQALLLEVGPLAIHLPPFEVCFANEFFQQVVRVKNQLAAGAQSEVRSFKIVEQDFARLDTPEQYKLLNRYCQASCAVLTSSRFHSLPAALV